MVNDVTQPLSNPERQALVGAVIELSRQADYLRDLARRRYQLSESALLLVDQVLSIRGADDEADKGRELVERAAELRNLLNTERYLLNGR